jgi:hypothetical protein
MHAEDDYDGPSPYAGIGLVHEYIILLLRAATGTVVDIAIFGLEYREPACHLPDDAC